MNKISNSKNISWIRILIFLFIAITISNVFRFDVLEYKTELKILPNWLFILITVLLEGSGVIIAALVSIHLLNKKRKTEISLFGTSTSKSLLMVVIPIIIITTMGITNKFGMNNHLYGFIAVIGTLLYCIMEEYGWRAYMQEELKGIKPWQKYVGIGFLWYLWHLTFLTGATIGENLFFLGIMILGSWGLGQVVESTKSIIASANFHLIIQIMMFNSLFKNGISGTEKMIVLCISIVIWVVIIKKWEKQNTIANTV